MDETELDPDPGVGILSVEMRRMEGEDGRKGAVSTGRNLVGLVIVALPGGEMVSEGESAGKPAGGLKCGGGGGGEKVAIWSLEGDVVSP